MKKARPTACPRCGGDLDYDRHVDRDVREGNDVAIVTVVADVCLRCGELLLHPGMTDRLVSAKKVLKSGPRGPVVGRVYDLRSDCAA